MLKSNLSDWFATPQGQYLLAWEQAKFDAMISDIFGYNAVQLGLPAYSFLRNNRMPLRFCCAGSGGAQVLADMHALPFAPASLDLVVMPHVLEFAERPHQVLREVERVLVPEGSIIIAGFNPYSLWGLHRRVSSHCGGYPWCGTYLSLLRIKDWLALLGFDTQSGGFGCYAPAVTTRKWIQRWRFMDKAGDRWWPVCGGAYMIQGVKRVAGMRLLTPNWRQSKTRQRVSAVAQRQRGVTGGTRQAD